MMDSPIPAAPLSPEIEGKIDALARQISVANRLDAEIQAELRGHIEDKLRGYLRSEIALSEADALLLAKAHFGNAEMIKGMFQEVHAAAHAGSLGRRLVAAFVAAFVVFAVMRIVDLLWTAAVVFPVTAMAGEENALFLQAFHILYSISCAVLGTLLLWMIFAFWRKRQSPGLPVWFETWKPVAIVAMLVGLLAVQPMIDQLYARLFLSIHIPRGLVQYWLAPDSVREFVRITDWFISGGAAAAQVILWMWWADRAPRTRRGLMWTGLYWVTASEFLLVAPWLISLGLHSSAPVHVSKPTDFIFVLGYVMLWGFWFNALGGLFGLTVYLLFRRSERVAIVG